MNENPPLVSPSVTAAVVESIQQRATDRNEVILKENTCVSRFGLLLNKQLTSTRLFSYISSHTGSSSGLLIKDGKVNKQTQKLSKVQFIY